MPLLTRLKCDGILLSGKPCLVEFDIGEPDTVKESARMLQITDAYSNKRFFCGIECLRRWAAAFEYPKQEEEDNGKPERHISARRTQN